MCFERETKILKWKIIAIYKFGDLFNVRLTLKLDGDLEYECF